MTFADIIGRLTRPEPHVIALSRRALIAIGAVVLALAGWAVATAYYFLFQDDIAAHLIARQSATEQAYQEKVGALRVHLDRLANQNLLEKESLDKRVSELAARSVQLESRQAILERISGVESSGGPKQDLSASVASPAASGLVARDTPSAAEPAKPMPVPGSFELRLRGEPDNSPKAQRTSERPQHAPVSQRLASVQRSLERIESAQVQAVSSLLDRADARLWRLRDALQQVGLNAEAIEPAADKSSIGGPFVPLTAGPHAGLFDLMVERLEVSMARLDHLGRAAGALPLGRPVAEDADLTSAFGYRIDPFTRGPAMHTGLDFRAEHGAPVRASGAGQVVAAEHAGGYGNMVEIDHGNGVTSRYAHLSWIAVSVGQAVAAGAVIGRAGSTGRSTGAHLHYETRIDGEAVDPQRFLRAGSRLFAQIGER